MRSPELPGRSGELDVAPVVVRVRSGRGEVVRAELLAMQGGRAHIRYLKEVDGKAPESWIDLRRLIGGVPGQEGVR